MKKTKTFIAVAAVCLLSESCKKEDTPAITTTTTTTTTTTNTSDALCKGNGSTAYIPLKLGNSWTYRSSWGIVSSTTITGTKVMSNSLTYFEATYHSNFGSDKKDYYRAAANGDIYCWYSNVFNELLSDEILLIPANPVVGKGWTTVTGGYDSLQVNSINASITSSNGCKYAGLVEIYGYEKGSVTEKMYYKKGLGLVEGSGGYLQSVVLK